MKVTNTTGINLEFSLGKKGAEEPELTLEIKKSESVELPAENFEIAVISQKKGKIGRPKKIGTDEKTRPDKSDE